MSALTTTWPQRHTLTRIAATIRDAFPTESSHLMAHAHEVRAREPLPPPAPTEAEALALEWVVDHRRAENTRRQYAGAWARFCVWVEQRTDNPTVTPTHPTTVILYLLHLDELGRSYSTLSQALAAISIEHREANLPDPTQDQRVRAFTAGIARLRRETRPKQAKPIDAETFDTLRAGSAPPDTLAMISVMRDALLRPAEAANVQWTHIEFDLTDGSGTLLIPYSKTDQAGQQHVAYLTPNSVTRLRQHIPTTRERPFPWHPDTISRQISRVCSQTGLGDGYSGHSARIGMLLDLIRRGATHAEAQREGRWRTPQMPVYYARNEDARRGAVAKYFG